MRSFNLVTGTALLLASALAGGCGNNHYAPNADTAELSSYAARTPYPASVTADGSNPLVYTVAGDGTITIYNGSNMAFNNPKLWVNGQFVINLQSKLGARTSLPVAPNTMFDLHGKDLTSIPPETISKVEIDADGKLYSVSGPVKPAPM
jgi:hypothetical protein